MNKSKALTHECLWNAVITIVN